MGGLVKGLTWDCLVVHARAHLTRPVPRPNRCLTRAIKVADLRTLCIPPPCFHHLHLPIAIQT